MVGFIPHRHFASERSLLSQEQRLLRFAMGPEDPATGMNEEFERMQRSVAAPNIESVRAAERDGLMRAMSAPQHKAGNTHEREQGGGGGEHAEGHTEHLRAANVQRQFEKFRSELYEKLKKFDDPQLQKLLPDRTSREIWAQERSVVDTLIGNVQDMMGSEIQPLVAWESGNTSPTAFAAWIGSGDPPGMLTKDQHREAYHTAYRATTQRIDAEIATAQKQLEGEGARSQGGALDSKGLDKLHTRIAELQEEKKAAEAQLRASLKAVNMEPDASPGGMRPEYDEGQYHKQQKHFKSVLGRIIGTSRGHPVEEFDLHASNLPSDYLPDLRDSAWQTYNQSTRQGIIQRINEHPAVGGLVETKLLMLEETLRRMQEGLKNRPGDELFQAVEHAQEKTEKDEQQASESAGGGLLTQWKAGWQAVGVKFYTVKGVMEGFHLWWEAWKGALKKYHHREGSVFASQLGKTTKRIPQFGEEVEVELEQNLDKADDEVKDAFLEVLKRRNVNFKNLVEGEHSELKRNYTDKNRTRAVLEYAASRGWLYDLLNDRKAADGSNLLFGYSINDLVPEDWKSNPARIRDYVSKLTTEQSSGQDAEVDKYYKRYYHVHRTPDFAKLMDKELDDYNMFGALGIMKRSLERGLTGYVTNWHAIQMMRRIQSDPVFRRYLTDTFLDKFGNMSLYNTHGRLAGGLTKLHKNEILKEARRSERTGTFDLSKAIKKEESYDAVKFYLGAHQHIEETLYGGRQYEQMSKPEREEFDKQFAQFTSGGIVEKDKKRTSIFTEKFDYWTATDVGQGQIKINDEDEDYCRSATWGAEQGSVSALLADAIVVKQILDKTGDGQFQNISRARFMGDSIVTHIEDLRRMGLKAEADHFIGIMGPKIDAVYRSYVSDARASGLADQRMIRQHINPGERTPYVLLEFLRLGLIKPDSLGKTILQTGGALSVNLIGQARANRDKLEQTSPGIMTKIDAMYDGLDAKNTQIVNDRVTAERAGGVKAQAPKGGPDEDAHAFATM